MNKYINDIKSFFKSVKQDTAITFAFGFIIFIFGLFLQLHWEEFKRHGGAYLIGEPVIAGACLTLGAAYLLCSVLVSIIKYPRISLSIIILIIVLLFFGPKWEFKKYFVIHPDIFLYGLFLLFLGIIFVLIIKEALQIRLRNISASQERSIRFTPLKTIMWCSWILGFPFVIVNLIRIIGFKVSSDASLLDVVVNGILSDYLTTFFANIFFTVFGVFIFGNYVKYKEQSKKKNN